MATVPFDMLKLARRLESAGFPPKQAGDTAEALAEPTSGTELSTKADVVAVKADIARVEASLRVETAAVRAEQKAEIAGVRAEPKAEIELLRRDLTIRLGSMIVVAVGVLLAAIRYLPASH